MGEEKERRGGNRRGEKNNSREQKKRGEEKKRFKKKVRVHPGVHRQERRGSSINRMMMQAHVKSLDGPCVCVCRHTWLRVVQHFEFFSIFFSKATDKFHEEMDRC